MGDAGLDECYGEVLAANRRMLSVLRDSGLAPAFRPAGTTVTASFRTTPTDAFLPTGHEHDRRAAVAALRATLEPVAGGVAVVTSPVLRWVDWARIPHRRRAV